MLVHIKDLIKDAKKGGYCLGSFNIHNVESIFGVARAAARANSPVMIQISESTIKYLGLWPIVELVAYASKTFAPNIPMALHLDHGTSFDSVNACIKAGFTSVHIDASALPLEENIALTNKVIVAARKKGVWVQGEVGSIMGGHGNVGGTIEIPVAKVEDVVYFVKKTKVDTIAAAIGTAHGDYDNEEVNIKLLKAIKSQVKIPFVLHGGSGIEGKVVKAGIKEGINIINIGTDIKVAFCKTVIENGKKNPNETDPRKLISPAIEAIEEVVYNKLVLFGSAGKVKPVK